MLRTALAVLHAQKKYVAADEQHMEAYQSGIKFWKGYYGDKLVAQVRSHIGTHGKEGEQAFQGAITLLRYAPELLSPSQYPRLAIVMMLLRHDPQQFIRNIVKQIRGVSLKTTKSFSRNLIPD